VRQRDADSTRYTPDTIATIISFHRLESTRAIPRTAVFVSHLTCDAGIVCRPLNGRESEQWETAGRARGEVSADGRGPEVYKRSSTRPLTGRERLAAILASRARAPMVTLIRDGGAWSLHALMLYCSHLPFRDHLYYPRPIIYAAAAWQMIPSTIEFDHPNWRFSRFWATSAGLLMIIFIDARSWPPQRSYYLIVVTVFVAK